MTARLIEQLSSVSARNDKIALLRAAFQDGERNFFKTAQICLDPTVSYGVKKIPLIEGPDEPGEYSFGSFLALSERLRKRELTGKAASNALHGAAGVADTREWNLFYRRALLKDFKIGVDLKTINKVLEGIGGEALDYLIPAMTCQLAQNADDHPKKLKGRKFLDIKFDGARLLTVIDIESKEVTQLTRSGNQTDNFPTLREQLARLIPHLPMSVVLDGEVIGSTFQELMTQFNRNDADTQNNRLMLFDMIPLKDFRKGRCNITQEVRHRSLVDLKTSGLFQELALDSVDVLPKIVVDLSTPEGHAQMEEFRQEALAMARANGDKNVIEGIMIKDVDAPYEGKKTTHWLKRKAVLSVSLEVIGLEPGEPEGKFANSLGALVCRGFDEGRNIEVNVSTGLSEDERNHYWKNPKEIIGHIIEVEADAFTQNENNRSTDTYSLRFPRFKGKRGTKAGEKI